MYLPSKAVSERQQKQQTEQAQTKDRGTKRQRQHVRGRQRETPRQTGGGGRETVMTGTEGQTSRGRATLKGNSQEYDVLPSMRTNFKASDSVLTLRSHETAL